MNDQKLFPGTAMADRAAEKPPGLGLRQPLGIFASQADGVNAAEGHRTPRRCRAASGAFAKIRLLVLVALVATSGLIWTGCGKSKSGDTNSERKVLYYQSAMHPWIKSDQPGRCTVCGMELTPIYAGEAGLDSGGDLLTLSETSIRVLNVQTTEIKTQALVKTLAVAGSLEQDETRRQILSAYVPGRIDRLHVNYPGAEINAGAPLAEFYSPMLLQTEREYRAIASSTNAELRAAVALRLRQMGLTAAQIEALPDKPTDVITSQILAPVGGTVVAKNVSAGQYVAEGEKLFELADFSTLWFVFLAYELDLPWLRVGQKVDVTTPTQPGKLATGTIQFIDPNLDAATRATRVRVGLDNPSIAGRRQFAHRAFAEGVVQLDAPEVLAVPRSAVIQTGPQAVAFVAEGGGGFSRRELQLGRRGDTLVEVLRGIAAGEQVVVQGNLLLDGQAEMNRAFATHAPLQVEPNHSAALPALTEAQQQAVKSFLAVADAVTGALAADNLQTYETQAARIHNATLNLTVAFDQTNAWQAFLQPIAKAGHLPGAADLGGARQQFHPFSEATVALVQALRRTEAGFAEVKVFRCPMTKNSFPGAPNRADWIQLRAEVRNPYYGAEMLDCGAEVKP